MDSTYNMQGRSTTLKGGTGNVALSPVSEMLSRVIRLVADTAFVAKDVVIEKSSFHDLSQYLDRISPILVELKEKNVRDKPSMRLALESLEREIKKANELVNECTTKSRIYLLYNCGSVVEHLQNVIREIGKCVSGIPITTLDVSMEIRDKTLELSNEMQGVELQVSLAGEDIVKKLHVGVREMRGDYAKSFVDQFVQLVGLSNSPASMRKELEKLKQEKDEALLGKKQSEAIELEQIIQFLSLTDSLQLISEEESESEFWKARKKTKGVLIQPLKSFYCPLTNKVMKDPVEIASGQTFERSAIEAWFKEGNTVCPITKAELHNLEIQSNVSLCNSIREWRDRNISITIGASAHKLQSEDEKKKISSLKELYKLSEEKAIHKIWIRKEGLIPIIASMLSGQKPNVRRQALVTLYSLAVGDAINKEKIADAGAIQHAVRSLARDAKESRLAVALLLELSKDPLVCERIGRVQGCILLLVSMSNNGDQEAAHDAKQLLNNLSSDNQNVVQMAEANYFKPLVQHLLEGSDISRTLMASALARMSLTEQSKATIVTEGVIPPLAKMISTGKLEGKTAALGALQTLSTHPENRDPMINAGVIPTLLQVLVSVTSVSMNLKELAATTLANLATATASNGDNINNSVDSEKGLNNMSDSGGSGIIGNIPDSGTDNRNILNSDDTILQLLSLLNLVGPINQGHLLRALNGMASSPPTATLVRAKMREANAYQLLLPFCEAKDVEIRANAVKLLYKLSEEEGIKDEFSELFGQTYICALVKLLSSERDDEKVAAAGVISKLPENDSRLTELLCNADALTPFLNILQRGTESSYTSRRSKSQLLEMASRALMRFTLPSNISLQHLVAQKNAIPHLVRVLAMGSPLAKKEAALVLSRFSENTAKLTTPIANDNTGCSCFFLFRKPKAMCRVHRGVCSVKGSFCLVEAGAVGPLIRMLDDEMEINEVHEASLCALSTLLKDETWERGIEVIAKADGLRPIVRLLCDGSPSVKERVIWILEHSFRVEKYRMEFGVEAQMPLIDLTQNGSATSRSLAARCLAHLDILHNQSTYF